jgi:DNA-binding XRE family transcriptional regulator
MKKLNNGWVDGSVKELLDLSEPDMAYIETKLALCRKLREIRARRGISQTAAATVLKTSQSRFAKMEKADPTVSLDLLVMSIFRLGATRKELAAAI